MSQLFNIQVFDFARTSRHVYRNVNNAGLERAKIYFYNKSKDYFYFNVYDKKTNQFVKRVYIRNRI